MPIQTSDQRSAVSGQRTSGDHGPAFLTPNPQSPIPLRPQRRTDRRAFTLTELLVVISIIAVLAAMVSVAVIRALDTAKQTRIKTEVDQLDMAFKAYREKFGSYPPCALQNGVPLRALVISHIARAFPRYNIAELDADLTAAGADPGNFRPDQALVFWLKGFSPDPAHPFLTVNNEQITNGMVLTPGTFVSVAPIFDFDRARLSPVRSPMAAAPTTIPSYFPPGSKLDSTGAPYVYWDSSRYANIPSSIPPGPPDRMMMHNRLIFNNTSSPLGAPFPDAGPLIHYALDDNGNQVFDDDAVVPEKWVNPDSYQIISSGTDWKYTSPPIPSVSLGTQFAHLYPTGTNWSPAEDDNVTNFCPKARLGDAKP